MAWLSSGKVKETVPAAGKQSGYRVSTELISRVKLTGALGPPLQLGSWLLPQLDARDFQCFLLSSLMYKFSELRRNLETMGPSMVYFLECDIVIQQRKKNKDLLRPTKWLALGIV